MAQDKEMSFLDHLEELRGHLLRGIGAIVVFTIIAFIAKDIVFGVVIFGPAKADFITYRLLCQATRWLALDGWGFCLY